MASPQCEDGYTRIANELLDAMCRLSLSQSDWKVLHSIIRKTYGWNQKADWISGSQLAQMTGLNRTQVCRCLKRLLDHNVILRDGRLTGVQKDYTLWQNVARIDNNRNVAYSGNTIAQTGNVLLPKLLHTKDTKTLLQKTAIAPIQRIHEADHPAIDVYAELTGKRPRRGTLQRDAIVRTVTDRPEAVQRWRGAIEAWLLCDNKATNVQGMLDWFQTGKRDNRTRPAEPTKEQSDTQSAEKMNRKWEVWNAQHPVKTS